MTTKIGIIGGLAGLLILGASFAVFTDRGGDNNVAPEGSSGSLQFLSADEKMEEFDTYCDECRSIVKEANVVVAEFNETLNRKKGLEEDVADMRDILRTLDDAIRQTRRDLDTVRRNFKVSAQENEQVTAYLDEIDEGLGTLKDLDETTKEVSPENIDERRFLEHWNDYNTIGGLDEAGLKAAQATGVQIEALEKNLQEQIELYELSKATLEPMIAAREKKIEQLEGKLADMAEKLRQLAEALRICEEENCDGEGECYYYQQRPGQGPLGAPTTKIISRPCLPGEDPGDNTEPPAPPMQIFDW